MRVIAKSQQTRHVAVGLKPNRTTVAAVATIRTTVHNRPLTTKTDAATTPVASANI
jgi:hypothetical protein